MTKLILIILNVGQDVGRSCILVTIGGKNIMFDCGKLQDLKCCKAC